MTLEEESRLSFYRELTVLDEKKNIVLVQDIRNSELCVKKTLDIYSRDVYEQLASVRIEGVPAVKECVADDGKLIVVEEYVQGRSLKQVLDEQGLLNEEHAYDIAVQLADILVRLHQLEQAANRERIIHWGPRTLDLDILFYDQEIIDMPDLHIPHIDLHNRDFVLVPMNQIAPYLRHPVLNQTISQLLDSLLNKSENTAK